MKKSELRKIIKEELNKTTLSYDEVKFLKKFNDMLRAYQEALNAYLHDSNHRTAMELKKQSNYVHLIHGDSFKEVEQILKKEHNI